MNTTKLDGVEVCEHDIYYYADEYIQTELKGDKELVKSRFVAMIYYIRDRIPKPSNDNIEL